MSASFLLCWIFLCVFSKSMQNMMLFQRACVLQGCQPEPSPARCSCVSATLPERRLCTCSCGWCSVIAGSAPPWRVTVRSSLAETRTPTRPCTPMSRSAGCTDLHKKQLARRMSLGCVARPELRHLSWIPRERPLTLGGICSVSVSSVANRGKPRH